MFPPLFCWNMPADQICCRVILKYPITNDQLQKEFSSIYAVQNVTKASWLSLSYCPLICRSLSLSSLACWWSCGTSVWSRCLVASLRPGGRRGGGEELLEGFPVCRECLNTYIVADVRVGVLLQQQKNQMVTFSLTGVMKSRVPLLTSQHIGCISMRLW